MLKTQEAIKNQRRQHVNSQWEGKEGGGLENTC